MAQRKSPNPDASPIPTFPSDPMYSHNNGNAHTEQMTPRRTQVGQAYMNVNTQLAGGSPSGAGGGDGVGSNNGSNTVGMGSSSTFQPSVSSPSPSFETYPGSPVQDRKYLPAQGQSLPPLPSQPSFQPQSQYQAQSHPQPYGQSQSSTFSQYDRTSSTSSFSSAGIPAPNEMTLNLDNYSRYDPSTSTSTTSYPSTASSANNHHPISLPSLNLPSIKLGTLTAGGNGPLSPGAAARSHEPISSGTAGEAVSRVTKAFGLRIVRSARRGQLPFLIIFFTCVIVFFMALLGVGYVEPSSTSLIESASGSGDASFPALGGPIGAAALGSDGKPMSVDERRKAEMKRLEAEWSMKKRPKDGLWMQSQRDQRARRRKPLPNSHEEYLQRVQDNKENGIVGQVFEAPDKD